MDIVIVNNFIDFMGFLYEVVMELISDVVLNVEISLEEEVFLRIVVMVDV